MIPEYRENMQNDDKKENCIQALESSLRQDMPSEITESVISELTLNAVDWLFNHGYRPDEQLARELAEEACNRYKINWKNKKHGEDNRGKRFGKSW